MLLAQVAPITLAPAGGECVNGVFATCARHWLFSGADNKA